MLVREIAVFGIESDATILWAYPLTYIYHMLYEVKVWNLLNK